MNSFSGAYDKLMQTISSFNKETIELWEYSYETQVALNSTTPTKFDSYLEDIPGFPKVPETFTMYRNGPTSQQLTFTDICFSQDATEGVDIVLSYDEIYEKMGPDSIPNGKNERPKPSEKKDKKKKKGKSRHGIDGISKSKSVAVNMSKL